MRYPAGLGLISATLTLDRLDAVKAKSREAAHSAVNADVVDNPSQMIPGLPLRHYETADALKQRVVPVPDSDRPRESCTR